MQFYLLAINLFALTALLLGVVSFADETRSERLLPLFLLVVSHSLAFIVDLTNLPHNFSLTVIGVFDVFSALCVMWVVAGPISRLTSTWRRLAWSGGIAALGLTFLPLAPIWPVPFQIHSLLVAMGGAFFVAIVKNRKGWLHVVIPLILAVAAFLSLLDLTDTSQFVKLLGYVILIGVIHRQNLQIYLNREQTTHNLVQELHDLNWEQQRWLEVSAMIGNAPNLNHAVEHAAHSLAQITRVDQAAIFTVDRNLSKQAHLLTLYSPHQPFHVSNPKDTTFLLKKCPSLQAVIDHQDQLLLSQKQLNDLGVLYSLWNEQRRGPTLLQPLISRGEVIGVLMLGNPFSQAPIRASDARLCRHLAAQIATIVEHRRHYLELEQEARAMTLAAKKRAEAPNEQQQAILEVISDGVVVINALGRVQFVNQAAEYILGKSGQTLMGQTASTIYRALDARQPAEDLMTTFAKRDQPLPTFIENDKRAIQGRLIPWRDKAGEFLGVIAVFRDVTREVRADRARNDFISALSHELRAPLTMITGYSELITNDLMGDYPPQQLQAQHVIHRSAERIGEILDNAIRISAQNRHRVLPRFEEIDVTKIIDSALREIMPLVRHYELKLTQQVEANLLPIVADPRHVHRILYNLLSNACRFTPPGGQISLRAWVKLDNWGRAMRPYLFITVTDNGIGIPKEEVDRVFDRFYHSTHQPAHKRSGMGMGLTVVKELVELHKGQVWVESEVGQGSTFKVVLPTSQEY